VSQWILENLPILVVLDVLFLLELVALRSQQSLLKYLKSLSGMELEQLLASIPLGVGASSRNAELAQILEEEVVQADSPVPTNKLVFRRPVGSILDDWQDRLAEGSWAALIGGSFTGIALFFTFLLIALVLITDVPRAISASTSGAAGASGALADAVGKMGAKFVISCGGIFFALFHSASDRSMRAKTAAELGRIARALAKATTTLDAAILSTLLDLKQQGSESLEVLKAQAETLVAQLEQDSDSQAELKAIRPAMAEEAKKLATELGTLKNIEVTVKDLGSDVTRGLGSLMKETLAAEVKQILSDVRGAITEIETRVTGSLQGSMSELGNKLVGSLSTIENAVKSQAGSQVESLLGTLVDRLEGVVSGGMRSEAKNLGGLLGSFQSTIPALASNVELMTAQMSQVLQDLRTQQAQAEVERREAADSAANRMKSANEEIFKSSGHALEQLFQETNGRIANMTAALESSAQRSAGSTASIRGDFEHVARLVGEVTNSLRTTASEAEGVMKKSQDTLRASSAAVDTLRTASAGLERAANGVSALVEKGEAARARTEEMLGRQAALTDEMQKVWPQLLQEVSTAMQLSSTALGNSWLKLADRLEKVTSRYGSEVGSKVEELGESIDRFIAAQKPDSERQGRGR
jgi:hypothetical protein